MNRRTVIIAGSAFAAVILLILLAAFLLSPKQKAGTTAVTIAAVPQDSTITLDGQTIKAGQQYLTNGKHTLKANRHYFDEVSRTIDTSDLDKNQTIYLLPIPSSADAIKWLQQHPDVQQQREAAGAATATQRQKLYADKYPIINSLPHEAIDFKADYGFGTSSNLVLTVTLHPYSDPQTNPTDYNQQLKDYKAEALQFLQTNHFDPNTTSVTWLPKDPDH